MNNSDQASSEPTCEQPGSNNGATKTQKIFAYWQGFTTSGSGPHVAPRLQDTPDSVDIIAIAFAVPDTNSAIDTSFITSKNNDKKSIIAAAQLLRSKGKKVVISINGNDKEPWGTLDPKTFANSVAALSHEWGLDGIDLDNETFGNTPGPHFTDVIKAIRDKMGSDFIISYPAYMLYRDQFLSKAIDHLSFVMTMAYWNDYSQGISMFESYEKLLGGPEKLMIGIKPGYIGANQSTPIAAIPKFAHYTPTAGSKAGIMIYSLSLDYSVYTKKQRFYWTDMIARELK